MQISSKVSILILTGLVGSLAVLYLVLRKKDHFTRTCLRDSSNARFVRTPVDFAMKIGKGGWQENPHWIGNPKDRTQPLDFGPVDLFADERKLSNQDELFKQYDNNWEGCGNGKVFASNDQKTRSLLKEVGNIGASRILDNIQTVFHGPKTGVPSETELSYCVEDPYPQSEKLYGGEPFYFQDTVGI